MSVYIPEKRLNCPDVSTSFLLVCAHTLLLLKASFLGKKICESEPDYQAILQIMAKHKHRVEKFISPSDNTDSFVKTYREAIADL